MYQDWAVRKIFGDALSGFYDDGSISSGDSASNFVATKGRGLFKYEIYLKSGTKNTIFLKEKNDRIILNGISLLCQGNLYLMFLMALNHNILNYDDSCKREVCIYENMDNRLKKYQIKYYGSRKRGSRWFIGLDFLNLNSRDKLDYKKVFDGLTDIHSFYYNDVGAVEKLCLNNHSTEDYRKSKTLLRQMFSKLDNAGFSKEHINKLYDFISKIDKYVGKYSSHRTLTHNDFSSRNIFCNSEKILFYDFELASFQNPEHDLIEFLVYELGNYNDKEATEIINFFRDKLSDKIRIRFEPEEYNNLLLFNVYEFIVNRFSVIRLANYRISNIDVKLLTNNINRLVGILEEKRWIRN